MPLIFWMATSALAPERSSAEVDGDPALVVDGADLALGAHPARARVPPGSCRVATAPGRAPRSAVDTAARLWRFRRRLFGFDVGSRASNESCILKNRDSASVFRFPCSS
jgi:hypothetical protein